MWTVKVTFNIPCETLRVYQEIKWGCHTKVGGINISTPRGVDNSPCIISLILLAEYSFADQNRT